jgi:hypothetical protein
MTKEQLLEKEEIMLIELKDQTLKMLERVKNNNEKPDFDFERAKHVIGRIFHNELDYLTREPDDYYELYMDYYFKDLGI